MSSKQNKSPDLESGEGENPTSKPKTVWHEQQMVILKEWGEKAGGYRWMHERAAARYKKMHIRFSLPVIILSTLAGTANFAQGSFTGELAEWAPSIIGGVNLLAGMITTVAQFLKIGELMEGHRVASITFGKFSRAIAVELSLPPDDRTMNGDEFLDKMRMEFDSLLEMAPPIPVDLGQLYLSTIKKLEKANPKMPKISLPEILEVKGLTMYMPTVEERAGDIVGHAAGKLLEKGILGKLRKEESEAKGLIKKATAFAPAVTSSVANAANAKAQVDEELANLRKSGAVKSVKQVPAGLAMNLVEDVMSRQDAPQALRGLAEFGGKANKMADIMRRSEPNLYASETTNPAEQMTQMMTGMAGDIISSKIEEGVEESMEELQKQAGGFLQSMATAGSKGLADQGDKKKK